MIEFKLNGENVTSSSESDTPLLWVIRDEHKLKGTKYGCGIARCGSCTVHIDGVDTIMRDNPGERCRQIGYDDRGIGD